MKIINNISDFNLNSYLATNKNFELINIENSTVIDKRDFVYILKSNTNVSIITNSLNKPYIYKQGIIDDKLYNLIRINCFFNNFISFYKKGNEEIEGIYDLEKEKILFETEKQVGRDMFENFIYTEFNDNIESRNINIGNLLWQFSLSQFPNYIDNNGREQKTDLKQFIGIYNNLLWVQIGGERLVALNVDNGELTHSFENIPKGYGDNHIDIQKGVIKILRYHDYFEFDLNTLKLEKKFSNEKFFFRSCNFYDGDNNLYFCGMDNFHDNNFPNAFGIFDTEKCEITWHETQKVHWGNFFNPPQANSKNIAALDDKGNLLIYKRDEIIN